MAGTLRRIAPLLIASFGAKLIALAIVYSLDPDRIVAGDTASYENPARALISTGRFARSLDEPERVETLRTPGYPVFIAAIFAVSGHSRFAVATGQIAVSTATLALVYALAATLWNAPTAIAALLFLALDLLSFVYAPLLHSETLFALAVVITALTGVRLLQTGAAPWALLFGSAAAWATLVRPIAYYLFVPGLGAIALYRLLNGQPRRRLLMIVLVAVLPWVALVEGWRFRNYVTTGRAEIAQITAVNLLWYRGAGIIAARDHISFWEARDRIARSLPDTTGWSPGAVGALYEREGLRLIAAHPLLFMRTQLIGLVKVLAGPGRADLFHYFAGVPYEETPAGALELSTPLLPQRLESDRLPVLIPLIYAMAYLVVLYVCVAFGVWEVARHERHLWASHAFIWWLILCLVVLAAGPEAYARFRVPVMPLLALYAGRGLNALLTFRRRRSLHDGPASDPTG